MDHVSAQRRLARRRFLAMAGAAGLLAAGCGRILDDETGGVAERLPPAEPPSGDREPSVGDPTGDEAPGDDAADAEVERPDAAEPDGSESDEAGPEEPEEAGPEEPPEVDPELAERQPTQWGERVDGVRTRLDTDAPVVALTFDGCGGPNGSGVDTALLDHLEDLAVPATLFLNARWIEANRALTRELARDPRYELANHGTEHRPLSVTGREAYGIRGTRSVEEVVEEVSVCQRLLTELAGTAPRHFRSGTAYVDEVAVAVVEQLGLEVVNFDVLGDAGATFSAAQVEQALLGARGGSIALLHLNHPDSGTAAGVAAAVPRLREAGIRFTTLGEHRLV